MGTPPLRPSARRFRGMPLTGLAIAAALALAGCGDGNQDDVRNGAVDPDDDAAQVDAEDYAGADDHADTEGDAEEGDDVPDGADRGSDEDTAIGPLGSEEPFASAEIADVAGNDIGVVSFSEVDNGVLVEAEVHDLDAGFRSITIHERGVCEPQSTSEDGVFGDFESSGGHLVETMEEDMGLVEGEEAPEEEAPQGDAPETDLDDISEEVPPEGLDAAAHPDHAGDLPNLLVSQDRTGWLSLISDRLAPEDLLDDEGSSVIIHAEADNHGNVPERYFGPDTETLTSGDSGSRVACGIIAEQ